MTSKVAIAGLLVAIGPMLVGLGGCQTLRDTRDRIVQAPPRCETETVPIYFAPDQADLSPEGRRALREAAVRAKGCMVRGINITGLADSAGDPASNLELSRRRAATVSAEIAAAGLVGAKVETAADGEAGAITPGGLADPMRRRAEVVFHLSPR